MFRSNSKTTTGSHQSVRPRQASRKCCITMCWDSAVHQPEARSTVLPCISVLAFYKPADKHRHKLGSALQPSTRQQFTEQGQLKSRHADVDRLLTRCCDSGGLLPVQPSGSEGQDVKNWHLARLGAAAVLRVLLTWSDSMRGVDLWWCKMSWVRKDGRRGQQARLH